MEIAYLSEKNVKIKGKQVTLVTALPEGKNKVTSDAVLLLGAQRSSEFTHSELGIVFQGPGEYEVKGTKITGFKTGEEVMYTVNVDGMSLFVGNVSSAEKAKDTLHEHDVALLFADEVLSQATMGVLNARIIIFVDGMSLENAKAFDKEGAKVNKYAVTKDKIPAETEFVFLG
ncbi:MAG TPA: hypothetical protein VEW42_04840 [Candidatus Eisenbacteria bacterium]|nr:hypothetical protein [Candidatus Eisenbacteria bacterium]